MVLIVPVYEEEQPGVYYNTAAVIDADGTYLGKYRKTHLPAGEGVLGEVLLPARATSATRCSTPRSAGSACTSATTGTSRRAGGRSAWPGPGSCSTPRRPAAACPQYLWRLEQPAAAVANEYFVGAINRVGVEPLGDNDFYGQSYFADPRGQLIGGAASDTDEEVVVRDLDMDAARRGPATCGSSTATAARTSTARWCSRKEAQPCAC